MGGYDAKILTVEAVDERTFGLAQPDRVLGQCLENGLEVQCGAADHLEELARGRLLLSRFSKFACESCDLCIFA